MLVACLSFDLSRKKLKIINVKSWRWATNEIAPITMFVIDNDPIRKVTSPRLIYDSSSSAIEESRTNKHDMDITTKNYNK